MPRTTSSFTFYCRSSKANKQGLSPVELSIIINGTRKFVNLPIKYQPEYYNRKRQPDDVKQTIAIWRNKLNDYINQMLLNNIPLTTDNLREVIQTGGVKSYTIQDLFEDFLAITRKRIDHDLTLQAYKKYEYVRNLFYDHIDKNKEITAITCSVIDSFYVYLQSRYNTASSASQMTRLKTIIKFGMDDGHLKTNPFKNVKVKHHHKKIEYLTEAELKKLYTIQIENKSLEDIRDAFCFQASTGLAYIDLLNLTKDDIRITEDGTHYITKTRHKTNSEYTTVILPMGVEILQKHNYELHILTNQKYNLFLKTLQALSGINKTLTTHLARKTFCCLLLNRGVSINTVAKCAGHKDIKITRSYYATLQEETVIKEVTAVF